MSSAEEIRLQARLQTLLGAAGDLLIALRSVSGVPEGTCVICRAACGTKHRDSCAAWPFIEARSEAATGHGLTRVYETDQPKELLP